MPPLRPNPTLRWFRTCRNFWLLAVIGCATTTFNVDDRVRTLNDIGLTDFTLGRFPQARECFEFALQLTPHDANLLYNLAQCDDRLGRVDNAERYYVECLQTKPNHVDARYALCMLYYRTGRKVDAENLLRQWLIEQPNSAEPYALDGWRLRQEKDLIAARDRLLQAMSKDQKNVHALTELGVLYETMHSPEYALLYYERSLARNPNQPDVIDRLAQLKLSKVGPPRPD